MSRDAAATAGETNRGPGQESVCSQGRARPEKRQGRDSIRPPAAGHAKSQSSGTEAREYLGFEHRDILRLQGLEPLGNVAIVNVAAVHLGKVLQGRWLVSE